MLRYTLSRLVQTALVLWALCTLTFLMLQLLPGDAATTLLSFRYSEAAAAALRKELGLDQPVLTQYLHFWTSLFHGDLGRSMTTNQSVADAVLAQFPNTLKLAACSIVIASVLGLAAGIGAAVSSPSKLDTTVMSFATLGLSIPNFFLGLILILVFGGTLHWIPVVGAASGFGIIFPALAIGIPASGYVARVVRSSVLETLGSEYLITARAKGLAELPVLTRHALRNSLIPIITVLGLQFGSLLGGAVIVENVFSMPGLGRLLVNAIQQRDIPMVQGAVLLFGLCFVVVNLLVDLSYTLIDPRVRLGAKR